MAIGQIQLAVQVITTVKKKIVRERTAHYSLNNLKSIKSFCVKECCDKLTFSIGKNYHIFYMLYSAFLGIWTQVNYLQSKIYNTVFVSRLEYKMENLFIIN